jgi:hypothetical protein
MPHRDSSTPTSPQRSLPEGSWVASQRRRGSHPGQSAAHRACAHLSVGRSCLVLHCHLRVAARRCQGRPRCPASTRCLGPFVRTARGYPHQRRWCGTSNVTKGGGTRSCSARHCGRWSGARKAWHLSFERSVKLETHKERASPCMRTYHVNICNSSGIGRGPS